MMGLYICLGIVGFALLSMYLTMRTLSRGLNKKGGD